MAIYCIMVHARAVAATGSWPGTGSTIHTRNNLTHQARNHVASLIILILCQFLCSLLQYLLLLHHVVGTRVGSPRVPIVNMAIPVHVYSTRVGTWYQVVSVLVHGTGTE